MRMKKILVAKKKNRKKNKIAKRYKITLAYFFCATITFSFEQKMKRHKIGKRKKFTQKKSGERNHTKSRKKNI